MFACHYCIKIFTLRSNLNRHIRNFHANEQAKKWSIEDVANASVNSIVEDVDEPTPKMQKIEEQKKFKCRYCENTYAKKYSRDLHQRATHEGDVICHAALLIFSLSWLLCYVVNTLVYTGHVC